MYKINLYLHYYTHYNMTLRCILYKKDKKMTVYNYIRVSTITQNTERQLQDVDCAVEFVDKVSGKDRNRPQLEIMLKIIKDGDVINCHSLDRLARNTQDLLSLVKEINDKGCSITFHKEQMTFTNDSNNPMNELMLTLLASFAQFERAILLERTREGVAIAKAKGKYKGRKSKLTKEHLQQMKVDFDAGIMSKPDIAKKYGVTRAYVYQLVKNAA